MIWSQFQQAVFTAIANGENIALDAVAGSGKSTTIVEATNHVPKGTRCLFVAFNKDIVTALSKRVPSGVEVSTLHSLGLKACSRALNIPRGNGIQGDRVRSIVADALPNQTGEWRASVVKCVSLCKSYLALTPEAIEDVIDLHQVCPPEHEEERPLFVSHVRDILEAGLDYAREGLDSRRPTVIDFDDMVFLPIILNLHVPTYDRVFVDETQDLNASQIALVTKALGSKGKVCAVGDPRQAIYQFRGACSDAFDKVRQAFNARVLPLSISYRCSKAVVREAAKIVPHLESATDAQEGSVTSVEYSAMLKGATEGDFILSRTNAPLMPLCMALLKDGKRAAIKGRDIGAKLAGIVKRAKASNVDELLVYVSNWADLEVTRLEKRNRDTTGITDTAECLYALAEGETTVRDILCKIEALFADKDEMSRITLSSTHKAKGLERDRVWILRSTYMRRSKDAEASTAEANLLYVACTRAKRDLYLVRDIPKQAN